VDCGTNPCIEKDDDEWSPWRLWSGERERVKLMQWQEARVEEFLEKDINPVSKSNKTI